LPVRKSWQIMILMMLAYWLVEQVGFMKKQKIWKL